MSFEKFTKQEKGDLILSVVELIAKEEASAKEDFEDKFLSSRIIRYPLMVADTYAGRDLILVFDPYKSVYETTPIVSYASPYYKIIRNEKLISTISLELDDMVEEYKIYKKAESLADFSGLFHIETGEVRIVVRNSYVPSRALQVALMVKGIPVSRVSVRHNEKGLTDINVRDALEKVPDVYPVLDELHLTQAKDLDPDFLEQIQEIKIKRSKVIGAVKHETVLEIGKDILLSHENSNSLDFLNELLKRVYSMKNYTLKRKVENVILNFFEKKFEEYRLKLI